MNSFYNSEELKDIGFKSMGKEVFISKKVSFYSPESINIGNYVRIDDFCILSGNITLGDYVHIAAFSAIYGGNMGIEFKDFTTISSKVSIYAISDDYSGEYLTNPMVPSEYKKIIEGKVTLEKHAIVGSGSVILPGVTLGEGASVGSMSLITTSLNSWTINVGIPAKAIKSRKKDLLILEKEFMDGVYLKKLR